MDFSKQIMIRKEKQRILLKEIKIVFLNRWKNNNKNNKDSKRSSSRILFKDKGNSKMSRISKRNVFLRRKKLSSMKYFKTIRILISSVQKEKIKNKNILISIRILLNNNNKIMAIINNFY